MGKIITPKVKIELYMRILGEESNKNYKILLVLNNNTDIKIMWDYDCTSGCWDYSIMCIKCSIRVRIHKYNIQIFIRS